MAMAMAMKEVATIRSETMPGRALVCPEQASQEPSVHLLRIALLSDGITRSVIHLLRVGNFDSFPFEGRPDGLIHFADDVDVAHGIGDPVAQGVLDR